MAATGYKFSSTRKGAYPSGLSWSGHGGQPPFRSGLNGGPVFIIPHKWHMSIKINGIYRKYMGQLVIAADMKHSSVTNNARNIGHLGFCIKNL